MIDHYYQIKGLSFGIATATATLPLSGCNHSVPEKLAEIRQQRRYLKHNPERFIEPHLFETEPVQSLIETKRKLVQTTKNRSLAADGRKSAWSSIAKINNKLLKFAGSALGKLDKSIESAENQRLSRQVSGYREFFFGLFPEENLRKIAESLTGTACK
jgi:hypothetical protein